VTDCVYSHYNPDTDIKCIKPNQTLVIYALHAKHFLIYWWCMVCVLKMFTEWFSMSSINFHIHTHTLLHFSICWYMEVLMSVISFIVSLVEMLCLRHIIIHCCVSMVFCSFYKLCLMFAIRYASELLHFVLHHVVWICFVQITQPVMYADILPVYLIFTHTMLGDKTLEAV